MIAKSIKDLGEFGCSSLVFGERWADGLSDVPSRHLGDVLPAETVLLTSEMSPV